MLEEASSTSLINEQLYVPPVKYHQTLLKRFVPGTCITSTGIMSEYLEANELSWNLYNWRLCSLFLDSRRAYELRGIMVAFFSLLSVLKGYYYCRVQLF